MPDPIPPFSHPTAWFYKTYQGWNIFVDQDDYGQGKIKKIYFAVNQETGDIKEIDISPYSLHPDLVLIIRCIDAGFPDRIGPAPLNHADMSRIENYERAAE